MDRPEFLSGAREELADYISATPTATFDPLNISPWLAMAALQKAIRRGAGELALRAAATLLRDAPDRLWRRCGGIAFEDIGLADLDTVALVTASLEGKRFRNDIGGEWPVAHFIVSRMAQALKCRAADDLLLTADLHPSLEIARHEFASLPTSELMRLATGSEPLPQRAIALWYVLGTNWRTSPHLRPRRGERQLAFDGLAEAGFDSGVVEIAREGFRKLAEPLPAFVALLSVLHVNEVGRIEDDQTAPETLVRDVPGWALDMYNREGLASLKAFLKGRSEAARWVRAHVPERRQVNFLGTVVFRVEGQLCKQRRRWPQADELRRLVDFECHGPHCLDATEVLDLMRADLPALDEVRFQLNGELVR